MQIFEGVASAADAVRRFYFRSEDDLPEHIRAKIEPHVGTGSSPVDLIVNFTEAVYRNRGTMTKDAKLLAAGTADIINQQGYHGRLDGRAAAMIPVLRREAGEKPPEGVTWPDPADDPQGNNDFAPPPPASKGAGE